MRTLIATVLFILAATGCTQQRDTGEKESTKKIDLKTLGWKPSGRFDEYYSKYSGSGLASGTALITWEESVSESPPPEGLLSFNPDNESRLKYPILNEFIDIPLSKENLLALGLPQKAPQGVNDCGFEVQATLVLGEYFKFDMEASDSGNDTSDIAAVVKSSPPKLSNVLLKTRKYRMPKSNNSFKPIPLRGLVQSTIEFHLPKAQSSPT